MSATRCLITLSLRSLAVVLFVVAALSTRVLAVEWTPEFIDTAAWYDAADTNTLWADTNGTILATATVARWDDRSGNGIHVFQASTNWRPMTGSRELNGLNVVDFVAYAINGNHDIDQELRTEATIVNSQPISYAGVIVFDSEQRVNFLFCNADNSGSGYAVSLDIRSGPFWTSSLTALTASTRGEADIVGGLYGVSPEIRINGGDAATSTNAWTGAFDSGLALGSRGGDGRGFYSLDGAIAELIVAAETWSTIDRQRIEGHLAHKWGLESKLPADHPYKRHSPKVAGTVLILR